jgi:chorismate-pyruvate lyase
LAAGPDLHALRRSVGDAGAGPVCTPVPADAVPEPYRRLLVHEHHMTVTVEAYHGCPVKVQVLARQRRGPWYARKILLRRERDDVVVQYGIARINLDLCSPAVRDAILSEDTPLGRILIQHNVMRRIQPTAYLHVKPDTELMRLFGLSEPTPTYGRLAYIHCDGKPAIELLEIVTPERESA